MFAPFGQTKVKHLEPLEARLVRCKRESRWTLEVRPCMGRMRRQTVSR